MKGENPEMVPFRGECEVTRPMRGRTRPRWRPQLAVALLLSGGLLLAACTKSSGTLQPPPTTPSTGPGPTNPNPSVSSSLGACANESPAPIESPVPIESNPPGDI